MKTDNGQTVSVWMATGDVPEEAALSGDVSADVCVVGAGIAGLTTAYLLAKDGQDVVVIDDGPTSGGETCRTTAHLVNALDDRFYNLERWHGVDGAKLAAESHSAAIDRIERIVRDEAIACDFMRLDGYLFVPPGDDLSQLDQELEAAHRAGLTDVVRVERAPLASFDTGPALRFPRQGQFHVLKYVQGLASAARRLGARLYNRTRAYEFRGGESGRVETDQGVVRARSIVVATNTPVNDLVAVHTKQAAYRTFVVGARVRRETVPQMLLWIRRTPITTCGCNRTRAAATKMC
jgi:glycine/D-amino acid oxidase-like deaminating enzyme